nr:response regulator transcription factor [Mitsuaria sp. TWR114]
MDIFLVEDSSAIRRLLARRLEDMAGVRVVGEADSAPQAIALIDWLQPDTVLLDMTLLVGTGVDVLRALRHKGFQGRILMLTHHAMDAYRDMCMQAGADGFYDKGSGLESLFGDLDELLQSERAAGRQTRPSPLLRDTATGLLGQVALLERLDQVLRMVNAESAGWPSRWWCSRAWRRCCAARACRRQRRCWWKSAGGCRPAPVRSTCWRGTPTSSSRWWSRAPGRCRRPKRWASASATRWRSPSTWAAIRCGSTAMSAWRCIPATRSPRAAC